MSIKIELYQLHPKFLKIAKEMKGKPRSEIIDKCQELAKKNGLYVVRTHYSWLGI